MSRKNAVMNKIQVRPWLTLYSFTEPGNRFGETITAIHQAGRAAIIDAAYPEYAERTLHDLRQQGIRPEITILSHYHPDHTAGGGVFSETLVCAGAYYHNNFQNCRLWEPEFDYVEPRRLLREGDELKLADIPISILYTPGHSRCGISVLLPENILHPGDLLMNSTEGKIILPYLSEDGDCREHIRSLERIRDLNPTALLLPHGVWLSDAATIHEHINDRLHYLRALLTAPPASPPSRCLKNHPSHYDFLEFHNANLIRLL